MTNLERWRTILQDVESAEVFINSSFYSLISCALSRNICWGENPATAPPNSLFPNLYWLFIAPPGTGKSVPAGWVRNILDSFTTFDPKEVIDKRPVKMSPSSITVQRLYQYIQTHYSLVNPLPDGYQYTTKDGKPCKIYTHSSCAFIAPDELENLLDDDSDQLVAFLVEGWNCNTFHREIKSNGEINYLPNLCLNMLGCATPEWVKKVSGTGLLKKGLSARAIFVYANTKRFRRLLYKFDRPEQLEAIKELKEHILNLTKLFGKVSPTPEAESWLIDWYMNGGADPTNTDPKLLGYYERKKLILMKLAMSVHFADQVDYTITLSDCKAALRILDELEPAMHRGLCGSGKNTSYDAAQELINTMETNPTRWYKWNELLLTVFGDYCETREDFEQALAYLKDVGKVEVNCINGAVYYRATQQPIVEPTCTA